MSLSNLEFSLIDSRLQRQRAYLTACRIWLPGVGFWEEHRSHFIRESSVKRSGQLLLCSVRWDSAQVCSPTCRSSFISLRSVWMSLILLQDKKNLKGHAAVCLIVPSPFWFSHSGRFFSLLMDSFHPALLPVPPLLSVSCFLPGPLRTSIRRNPWRQRVISTFKDSHLLTLFRPWPATLSFRFRRHYSAVITIRSSSFLLVFCVLIYFLLRLACLLPRQSCLERRVAHFSTEKKDASWGIIVCRVHEEWDTDAGNIKGCHT